jgi:SanA protein
MTLHKTKKSTKKMVLLLTLLLGVIILAIPFYVKYKAQYNIFSNIDEVQKTEFALVLGAAINNNNKPSSYLKYRLDDVVDLYKAQKIEKVLISGDNGEDAYDEISVMNNYLVQNGIPQSVIYGDYAGFDTYSSMERAKKIFGIKKAIIVSQGFHLPRSLYIANQKGMSVTGYATKQSFGKRQYFIREYFATIKSFFDCFLHRKPKYYGAPIDTNKGSNIELEQLKQVQ